MKDYTHKAAEYVLCKPLPKDWETLGISEQNEFIYENAWEPFDKWEADDIYKHIEDLARGFQEVDKASVDRVLTDVIKKINPKPTY